MQKGNLYILWTNDSPVTSELMVMMYAENAMLNNWWDKITVIIWGATTKLVADNTDIQKGIEKCREAGVEFSACLGCAAELGTVEKLENLGIELKYWGVPLTDLIKNRENLITV